MARIRSLHKAKSTADAVKHLVDFTLLLPDDHLRGHAREWLEQLEDVKKSPSLELSVNSKICMSKLQAERNELPAMIGPHGLACVEISHIALR